ncbi:MAG: homocysteine S-methyltransferase family protein [Streptococcus sp.]
MHETYVAAGSDLITTSSYQATLLDRRWTLRKVGRLLRQSS